MNEIFVSERPTPSTVNLKRFLDPVPIGSETQAVSDTDERYRAPALDKGLDILELLAGTDAGMSQAEIAKALARSPNEIYRMLDRLVRRGYVMRDPGDRYELSLKLFALAHQHAPLRRLVSQATTIMRRVAREAAQSIHLAVYERGRVAVVAQVESPGYWGLAIRVGAQVDLLNTGSGHVLLAFQTPRERQHMLAERDVSALSPSALKDLLARLDVVRERGFEVMESQQTRGVLDLSVPVLGEGGVSLAALTCPYVEPVDQGSALSHDAATTLMRAAGRELSLAAGGAEALGG